MLVRVGSTNKAKVKAVKEAFNLYFKDAKIEAVKVERAVSEQPTTLQEIIDGAKVRAEQAFNKCDYGVGIEGGVFPVKGVNTGYIAIGCCAIYDGRQFYFGFTPGFEYPRRVIEKILADGKSVKEIFHEFNPELKEDFHERQGAVGILTKGEITRDKFNVPAVIFALAQIVNKRFEW